MDDPNFAFLKEQYPNFYESCKMIDFSFVCAEKEYKYPVALSILALEEMMKFIVNKKSGDLFDIINIYCKYDNYKKDLCDDLHYIRKRGNKAKHEESFNRYQAVKVVKKFHECIQELFDFNEKIPEYAEITGEEDWITPI